MRRIDATLCFVALLTPTLASGQTGGSVSYGGAGGRARAEAQIRQIRTLSKDDQPTGSGMFIEANILLNVKADEYVALFTLSQEGETSDDCTKKSDAAIARFRDGLKALKIEEDDVFVDFVSQNRIYAFEIAGNVARERPVGFELKRNISVRFRDRDSLQPIVNAASRAEIFDLVKVQYVVKHLGPINDLLMEAASKVIKQKRKRYETLLDITLRPPARVWSEKTTAHYPTQMYDSFTAFEAQSINPPDRQQFTVQTARKSQTFFFNPLDSDGFDEVINPVVVEPVVQFTLHLKLQFETKPTP